MKKLLFLLFLAFVSQAAQAQVPAVISAPISEKISRKQLFHQGVSTVLRGDGKRLAGAVKKVSGAIKTVSSATNTLHEQWYSSMLSISPAVRNYRRVEEIYTAQRGMIDLFSGAITDLRKRGFSPAQLSESSSFFQAMLQENIGLMGELATVLASSKAKMTDPQRIKFIDRIADKMAGQQNLMNYYTNKCQAIAWQQQMLTQDRAAMLSLMGLDK